MAKRASPDSGKAGIQSQVEANFSALIESREDHVWSVDLNGRLILFNRAFQRHIERVYGVTAAVGMRLEDLFLSERLALWQEFLRRALSEGPFRIEYPMLGGRTLELAINPIVVDGETTGVSVFGKDITERKAAESALQEAEKKYRAIFDGALEGMFQTSPEGRLISANPALAMMLGYDSPDELISLAGNVGLDVWAEPEDRVRMLRDVAEHGAVREFECRLKRKDKTIIWASLNVRRVCGADGRLSHFEGFIEDITERKRAARALAESEARFRTFFEENSSVMLLVDPSSGEIVSANRAASAFYGYPLERLVGMNLSQIDILPPEELVLDRQRALDKECSFFAYRGRLASGEVREIEVYSSPIVVDGRPLLHGIVHDVTERKRAADALRVSEESLRESQRIAGLGSYNLDIRTGAWSSTEVLDAIFGIDPACEHTIERWEALLHPDDRVPMTAYFAEEVAGKGHAFDKEYRIVRQTDWAERWVHGLGRLDFNAQGRPVRMRGTIKDITERKQAETQLRESEERYRATFEQAAVGIIHVSFEGRILRCNTHFAEILGYASEELTSLTIWQISLPEDQAQSTLTIEQAAKGAAPVVVEKRYICKDGSFTWARITVSMQRDTEGRPQYLIALAEDINARKTAEERLAATQAALRASEERHRIAFQASANAVCIVRLEDGMYLDVNEAFLSATGFERDEVIGRTARELNTFASPGDLQIVAESLRGNSVIRAEFQFKKKSGECVWGLMSASPFEHDGVSCALCVTQDISEAKAAAERLAAATEALRAGEERYRTVFQTSVDGICVSSMSDGRYIDANKAFLDLLGFDREEIVGQTSHGLNLWTEPELREVLVDKLRRDSSFRDVETQFVRKNGMLAWFLISGSVIEIDGTQCVLSIVRDVSAAKAAEERLAAATEALRVSEERYRTAFQTSLDGITINRLSDGMYIECNKAFLDITAYEREDVIGKTSLELGIWADLRNRHRLVEILRQNSSCRDLEVQFRKKSGEVFWVVVSASLIELDGDTCLLSMVRDISGAKDAEDRIRSLAFYDSLTGLPNRRLLLERLRETLTLSVSSRRRQALLLVNLDHFKMLNETLGHQAGDYLLQEAGRRIISCVGEAGTVAKFEGDEFVVTLDGLGAIGEEAAERARTTGKNILAAVSRPYLLAGREFRSTASIGITVFGDNPETAEEVLQKADIALDQAKAAGRNTLHLFAPEMQVAVNARATLEEDLHQTIKTNQFVLYYQPQLNRGQLIGAEALIRWNHPRRGLLAPGEFIPLAEETGLILPLGDWVLETACKQIARWADRASTAHVVVAVNISARQFRQPDFVQRVLAALDRTGANPRNLDLELTESMLAENIEEIIAKMTELKAHGLRFSLDDFGTGYSSLAYLRRLPLDLLKIDRSFVRDILVDASSGAIAQTILSLSKAMNLPVIAEGVETEEQRKFLTNLGCHSFQGFLFSRPLPLEEFERQWLNSEKLPAPYPE
jgi:diguanylate cyclase (GGDEF)-like protein/PAS domain S-box-containing protein